MKFIFLKSEYTESRCIEQAFESVPPGSMVLVMERSSTAPSELAAYAAQGFCVIDANNMQKKP